jgi:enoyl-CoA hydratase/carnithine racemase
VSETDSKVGAAAVEEAKLADPPPVVRRELQDGVLLVKYNRPERMNAAIPEMTRRYMEILLEAADDPEVRVIVVTGEGRAFCAGVDTAYLASLSKSGAQRAEKLRRHWFTTGIPKPVIAAINGPCVGLGFVMAVMCDLRFAADTAKVGPGFATLGLPAENGTGWMLPRIVGHARAFEILASGMLYSGDELLRLGLVNAVLPEAELMPHVLRLARHMAIQCSPRSLAAIKAQLHSSYYTDVREGDRLSDVLTSSYLQKEDLKEAARAKKEQRPPRFAPLGGRDDWWPAGEKLPGET